MTSLLYIGLNNILVAALLAIVAFGVGRLARRPALTHALWLLVLLKLVTPPLFFVPIPLPRLLADEPASAELRHPIAKEMQRQRQNEAAKDVPPREIEPSNSLPCTGHPPLVPGSEVQLRNQGNDSPADVEPPKANPVGSQTAPGKNDLPLNANRHSDHLTKNRPAKELSKSANTPIADWDIQRALGLVWIAGSFFWFVLALVRVRRFSRLLRQATAAAPDIQAQAESLAHRLGLARCPKVWQLPGTVSPMLWGWGFSSRLLIPAGLLERLSSDQRATLFVHELAHYQRRDHWVRYLELVVLGLYWWCPLAWWARGELHQAEEECCDAWVVWALPSSARAYATALVDTLDFLSGAQAALPPVASGLGRVNFLKRRLTMIMRGTTPRMLSRAGVLALLAAGAMMLPLLPGWAQEDRRPERQEGEERQERQERKEVQGRERAERLEQLKRELEEIHRNFERQRREFERHVREIRERMGDLGFKDPPRPDDDARPRPRPRPGPDSERPNPRPRPDVKPHRDNPDDARREPNRPRPHGDHREPERPHIAPDFERRLRALEQKLDMILQRLGRQPFAPRPPQPSSRLGGSGRRPDGTNNPFAQPRPPQPPVVPRPPGSDYKTPVRSGAR